MFFYSIGIKFYVILIHLASIFNKKASKAINGRKDFFKITAKDSGQKYIWFHASSLGEFEQGRPIIEKIKRENKDKKILLSFYSPSGFEVRKNYEFADKVIYLPFDSASNARKFFDFFQIEMAVFIKYDVWPFFAQETLRRKIPFFLTSAVFRNDHFYFKWYAKFFLNFLKRMNRIYVQDEDSVELAKKHGLNNVERTGDARIDRVIEIKSDIKKMPEIEKFVDGKKCIVFGSVYHYEIPIIQSILNDVEEVKLIVAPHIVDDENLELFLKAIPETVLYKNLDQLKNERVLLIDHIGSLNRIYQYATIVYIGGGYNKGIHNILEPAVYNIPVFIGPSHTKFPEANSLRNAQLVFVENSATRLAKMMAVKLKENQSENFVLVSQKWFVDNSGSTDLIYNGLLSNF